jgi:predicted dehydrogenase
MRPQLRIAMIGHGIMGRMHANAYRQAGQFFDLPYEAVLQTVCGVKESEVQPFAEHWGWKTHGTDWRRAVESDDIDIVDIVAPNHAHFEIAIAATEAGKIVLCEKPLALNAGQAFEMANAVQKSGKPSMTWFNYRRIPALAMARDMIGSGKMGSVLHYRGSYLQDWALNVKLPAGGDVFWRFDAKSAGSGAVGDLLAHSIDTALWLNGPITSVSAMTCTFQEERYSASEGRNVKVEIDDAAAFIARFGNGSIGVFEGSRFAAGRKNSKTMELNARDGSLCFDLEDQNHLSYFDAREEKAFQGWKQILTTEREHPYMKQWWMPGCLIGYEHSFIHTVADFLEGLGSGEKRCPDFEDGYRTQLVCDAILQSAREKRWVDLDVF